MDDRSHRSAVAEQAARAGGAVASEAAGTGLTVETKSGPVDHVTAADRDAQQRAIAVIADAFAGEAVVGEETVSNAAVDSRESVPEDGPAWVVDPIDGTTNYLRGLQFWGCAVAAVVDAVPAGVAMHMPAMGDTFAAGPDGVTHNGEPMTVNTRADVAEFVVGAVGWWPREGERGLAQLGGRVGDVRRFGCLQGTLARVAAGGLDAAVMPARPHPWDAVAGAYMIDRAGGTVTDIDGEPWCHDSQGLVASNGRAHEAVLAAARELA